MLTKSTNRWVDKRRRVQESAEGLARRFSKTLPTDLGLIGRAQKVREFDFRPLIVDGGLSLLDDGFLISVRCEEEQAERFRCDFNEDSTGRTLPSRARFTIAHEIGHTFFFDLEPSPPESLINYKDRRILPTLEAACSRAARQLLIPEFILQRDFRESDFLDPQTLRRLAELACVSPAAVVVRLNSLSKFAAPYGMIVCVDRTNEGVFVQTVARHEGFRDVFPAVERGALIRSVFPNPKFILSGGDEVLCEVEESVAGKRRRYTVKAENLGQIRHRSCFMTISRIPD